MAFSTFAMTTNELAEISAKAKFYSYPANNVLGIAQRDLNVRTGHGKQYKVRGIIKKGTRIRITRVYENGSEAWYVFKYKGKKSYVSARSIHTPYAG